MVRLVLVCFTLLSLAGCGDSSSSHIGASSESLTAGRWSELPVVLYVDDTIADDPDKMNDVREAAAFWEIPAQMMLFELRTDWGGPVPPFSGTFDEPTNIMANLMFFVDAWPYSSSIKGHTVLHRVDDTFRGGVIYLQEGDYCVGACESDFTRISFRRLVAHEFGHFLGLKHMGGDSDIMNATIPGGAPLSSATFNNAALQSLVR